MSSAKKSDNENINDENDSHLETGGDGKELKAPSRRKLIPESELNAMVAASMKDILFDQELPGDEDDPDLLNELRKIAGDESEPRPQELPLKLSPESPPIINDMTKLLNDRLKMYEEAEKNAKASGEASRTRRFDRGIKTLEDLIKQANAGRSVNIDDIPPEVSTGTKKPAPSDTNDPSAPTRAAPPIPTQPKLE